MKILVSGASGMIGAPLVQRLRSDGHTVTRLVRSDSQQGDDTIRWRPQRSELDPKAVEGHDAVIHLAGENIAGKRWNDDVKARMGRVAVIISFAGF